MTTPDRTVAPEIRQLDDFSMIRPERHRMRNGMPLFTIQAGSEEVVRFDLVVRSGQLQQDQPLQAVFTNRMLREGSRVQTSAEIAEMLDYYGAWLDLSVSVDCSFVTLYSLSKYFGKTIEVVASMVKEAVFPEKEFAVIRDIHKHQFMVNNQRVDVLSRKQLNRSLFGITHPLGRYAELDDYDRIDVGVLKEYYRRNYNSGNCSAYLSGNVTRDAIRCVEQHFGDAEWGNALSSAVTREAVVTTDSRKRVFVEKEDAMQSSLRIGGFTLDRKHPDYLKFRVLVTLFGGYFGSRLMSNIREEKGYTYGIGAGIVAYPGTGLLVVSTETANEYVEQVISEVYHEMDRLREERVSDAELEMVRNYMLGDMCRSYENPFSLSDAWAYIETSGLDTDYYCRSLAAIRETLPEEIQLLAQKYFCKENLIEVVAGKKV